jgi:long-subunit fatty acid transport protein
MGRRFLHSLLAIVAAIMLVSDVAKAQVDAYHFTGINFNFANPGARARGIGGAFVALADDATAALANPAGLAYLDRQISIEYIHDEERAPVGQVTQGNVDVLGQAPFFTYVAESDPYRVWAESESDRVNFASVVLPVASRKVGLALYYAALADLSQEYDVGSGFMCVDGNDRPYLPGAGESCAASNASPYYSQRVSASLETRILGGGFGWKLGDNFSIGASAAYAETVFNGLSRLDPFAGLLPPMRAQTSSIDDTDVLYSVGALFRGDVVGFGLSYRSEASFGISNDVLDVNDQVIPDESFVGEFIVPERIAAGLALFPSDRWVIAGEYVRIPYSDMPPVMATQFFNVRQQFGVEYASADVDEYHAGIEYTTFTDNKGWSLRLGYWRDQTHLIFSSQGLPDTADPGRNRVLAAAALLYQELELALDHFTAGIGAAFGTFRLDAAVDYSSDGGTDFLLSGVIYF